MTQLKPINTALFAKMWRDGATSAAIGRAVGLDRSSIAPRAKLMGLPERPPGWRDRKEPDQTGRGPRVNLDRARFTEMWVGGVSTREIKATLHIGDGTIKARVAEWGLEPRHPGWNRGQSQPRNSKPRAEPKAKPEPVYQPGLSAAIKRAGSSVERIGKVATTYRVPYREVLAMAGVQA